VNEAAQKLNQLAGRELRYSVVENQIATVGNSIVANCRLAVAQE
jgi:hypothetical protein